jgi:hypothetical protein
MTKIYQRGKPSIEEVQTPSWPKDTKGRLTPLLSFGHDVVCTSSIDGLPLWYLLVMMLSVLLRLTAYLFGIFWSWWCLYFFDWRLTPLISFGHDVVCTSSIDGLPLWYLLVMMLSVLLWLTAYPFGMFWSWCCLYFFETTSWPKDTKGVSRQSKKYRQHHDQKIPKG